MCYNVLNDKIQKKCKKILSAKKFYNDQNDRIEKVPSAKKTKCKKVLQCSKR